MYPLINQTYYVKLNKYLETWNIWALGNPLVYLKVSPGEWIVTIVTIYHHSICSKVLKLTIINQDSCHFFCSTLYFQTA